MNNEVRVASPKEVMIMLVFFLFASIVCCFFDQAGGLISKKMAGGLTDKKCKAVDMYTEYGFKTKKKYTTFEDEEGYKYALKTTINDYIGRESLISVSGTMGYRKNYEIIVPNGAGWAFYLMPFLSIISLIIFPIKAKKLNMW